MKKHVLTLIKMVSKNLVYGILLQCVMITLLFAEDGAAQVRSLDEIHLKLEKKVWSFEEIIQLIENNTEFRFVYPDEYTNGNLQVTTKRKDLTVQQVLKSVARDTRLKFKQINGSIYIGRNLKDLAEVQNSAQQTLQVTGKVTSGEDNTGLPGVNVVIKGTSQGTVTDIEGNYSLQVPSPETVLIFSYVGYLSEEIAVGDKSVVNVSMVPNIQALDEIVVIGYGTQQRKNVVGAVDQIASSALAGQPVGSVTEALQGASANLIIQQRSSEPGSELNINIRGISTMNDNSPLVIIDGLAGGDMSLLNPADIESISVLKDAGSAAIYGSRAANGVILITTKKGKKNTRPVVSFNAQAGINSPQLLYEPVKGYENAILRNQALVNTGNAPVYSAEDIRQMREMGDNEWFLETILQDAMRQNYNFGISGGGENTTYMVSGGYLDQESNFIGSDYGLKRYNFRMNMTNEYGRLKLTTIMAYARTNIKTHTSSTSTLIVDAGRVPPYYNYSLKDRQGRYLVNDVLSEFNPMGILEKGGTRNSDNDNLTGKLSAELDLFDGLTLKGAFGANLRANHTLMKEKQVNYFSSSEATEPSGISGANRSTHDDSEKVLFLTSNLMLDYNKSLGGNHHVNALIGISNESYTRESNGIRLKFTDPDLNTPNTETIIEKGTFATPEGTTERSLNSLFGRAGYSFREKYIVEFNFRYDGSSKFSADNRWGFFPSASAGWRMTEENFMSSYRENIGELKLRASYGVLGNQNVDDYQYQTTYFIFNDAYGFNNSAVAGTGFTFANEDLRWEKSATFNVGLDGTYLRDRLSFSLDYFNKLTTDILIPPAVPGTYGGAVPNFNAGKLRNQGWEVSLGYRAHGPQFNHDINFNIADSWNEVVYFEGDEQIESFDQMQMLLREGLPFNSYLGYKRDGYFQNLEEVQNDAKPIGSTVEPGDIRYKDKNRDGVIDDDDRYVLGNAFPRYTFGLQYSLGWKNFDLGVLIQGVGKRKMFLRGELVEPFHSNYSYVMYTHQLDYWTPVNPDAEYPRLASPGSASNANNYGKGSDLYLFDASYIRLKNVQIGYSLPEKLLNKIGAQKLRVYVTARNLFTLSNIPFIDPESTEFNGNMDNDGANSGRNYPTLQYYGIGVDLNF